MALRRAQRPPPASTRRRWRACSGACSVPPTAPWLHGEVARRMAERLPVIRLQPDTRHRLGRLPRRQPRAAGGRLSAGAAAGGGDGSGAARRHAGGAGDAVVVAAALGRTARGSGHRGRTAAPGRAQLLWSNMGLHGAIDPQAVMRCLAPGAAGGRRFPDVLDPGPGFAGRVCARCTPRAAGRRRMRPSSTCTTSATCWWTPVLPTR